VRRWVSCMCLDDGCEVDFTKTFALGIGEPARH
jgi:hypothetical protein